jgi:predicted kinase
MKIADLTRPNRPTLFVPIGPSGSGKTTLYRRMKAKNIDMDCFSLDSLRLEWYNKDDYDDAWQKASKDKEFATKANQRFVEMLKSGKDLCVDGTNLSPNKRKFFLGEAKKHNYRTVALVFNVDAETLEARRTSRDDKRVPADAVKDQIRAMVPPQRGEFDDVKDVKNLE